MRNLQEYFEKCIDMCYKAKIPYGVITGIFTIKSARAWGICHHKPDGTNYIDINEKLIDEEYSPTDDGLINTILHEILHTCPDCQNHGTKWKFWCRVIQRHYGIVIKRTNTSDEKYLDTEKVNAEMKYLFKCCNCGLTTGRTKASAFTKNYGDYCCAKCGGKFEKIK